MTPEAITARNRANAAKSTGPRSAAGKAAVAQNARRHGATAQPDPERVATWARIILDAPDLGPSNFLEDNVRTRSALALAAAEVRLAETTQALDNFMEVNKYLTVVEKLMEHEAPVIEDLLREVRTSERGHREALLLFKQIQETQIRENKLGGTRHRLLKRYFREARAQRRRAFQDWLACVGDQQPAQPANSETSKIPKQSQIST